MNNKALLGVLAAGLLAGPMAAEAVPVTWTLEGTLISYSLESGTANGSFTYDADTGEFSNISLTTSFGRTYTQFYSDFYDPLEGLMFFQEGDPTGSSLALVLHSIHLPMLTNAGGVLQVNQEVFGGPAEVRCDFNGCTNPFQFIVVLSNWDQRAVSTLTGVPSSVPEPGTLALFGLGLAGLGLARRRRSA